MANGTIHRTIARADRLREQQKPDQQATTNAINNLRELPMYREEMESNSEVTVGFGEKLKVGAKGIPSKALGAALIILAVAAAIVAVLRAWG